AGRPDAGRASLAGAAGHGPMAPLVRVALGYPCTMPMRDGSGTALPAARDRDPPARATHAACPHLSRGGLAKDSWVFVFVQHDSCLGVLSPWMVCRKMLQYVIYDIIFC